MSRLVRSSIPALLKGDRTAFGVYCGFLCAELIEAYGALGFQWLFLDAQHTPLNPPASRELVRAADLAGLPCVVRVPAIEASIIEGYLDVGVAGIIAPDVHSAADAQALVSAVKFAPLGKRGAAARSRAAQYGLVGAPADYFRRANELTFTVALIESQQGIDELEAIMAVPGIDAIGIGANDLGLSMGIDAGIKDPRVRSLVEGAQLRIKAANKPQMAVANDAQQARAAAAAGSRLVATPDFALLAAAGRAFLNDVRGEASLS